jgi:hypothetical protein
MWEKKYMKFICKSVNKFILNLLPCNWRDSIWGLKRFHYGEKLHPRRQILIASVDGSSWHGGLCDRFKGIVSLFHYCLCKNIPFKINYTYPFALSDYLLPNEYDWQLSEAEIITYHICEAKYINLIGDPSARRFVQFRTKKQIHAYANRDIVAELNRIYNTDYQWGELFKKLFSPTKEMSQIIQCRKLQIGGEYICVAFRFQNLLGDFTEYQYRELPDGAKTELIARCRQSILDIQQRETCKRILVTSDSVSFLETLPGMTGIYTFSGKTLHVDTVTSEMKSHEVYMKSFLDFYLLSEGLKIYSVGTRKMYYQSDFPRYAAKLNNIPFERIEIA